jgi:hypothetical protein
LLVFNIEYFLCAICAGDYPAFVAKFLLDKARDKANATWDAKGYSDEKLQQILDRK